VQVCRPLTESFRHGKAFLVADIREDDCGAFPVEKACNCLPDATGRPGDQGCLLR
jgi:hypothetical protein